jgi:hypothetical protein
VAAIQCAAIAVWDAVLRRRVERAEDTPCHLSALMSGVSVTFQLLRDGWISNSIRKTGLASWRRISTRQRLAPLSEVRQGLSVAGAPSARHNLLKFRHETCKRRDGGADLMV